MMLVLQPLALGALGGTQQPPDSLVGAMSPGCDRLQAAWRQAATSHRAAPSAPQLPSLAAVNSGKIFAQPPLSMCTPTATAPAAEPSTHPFILKLEEASMELPAFTPPIQDPSHF